MKKATFTRKMRAEAKGIMAHLREDYEENNDKIGRIRGEAEFETYSTPESYIREDGSKWYKLGTTDTNKPIYYECVLFIYVPLKGMSFEATDRYKYRWNSKYEYFEYEEKEII